VCEEIARFVLDNQRLTAELKTLRHRIDTAIKKMPSRMALMQSRDSLRDVGKSLEANGLKRNGLADILFANLQRVKESIRVLEEFSKLKNIRAAAEFKKIRYRIYVVEKNIAARVLSLRHPGSGRLS